jgi:hypothetical protein
MAKPKQPAKERPWLLIWRADRPVPSLWTLARDKPQRLKPGEIAIAPRPGVERKQALAQLTQL